MPILAAPTSRLDAQVPIAFKLARVIEEAAREADEMLLLQLDEMVVADSSRWLAQFAAQAKLIDEGIGALARFFPVGVQEAAVSPDDVVDALMDAVAAKTSPSMMSMAITNAAQTTAFGYEGMAQGMGLSFKLNAARATRVAAQSAAKLVSAINETTRGELKAIITNGLKTGQSWSKVGRIIKAQYGEFGVKQAGYWGTRANLVAITEAGTAYERGKALLNDEIEASGIDTQKRWTIREGNVCDLCRSNAAAGWIKGKESFPTGADTAPQHPACRCFVGYRVSQDPEDLKRAGIDPATITPWSYDQTIPDRYRTTSKEA
jgi:hypothetical protein